MVNTKLKGSDRKPHHIFFNIKIQYHEINNIKQKNPMQKCTNKKEKQQQKRMWDKGKKLKVELV